MVERRAQVLVRPQRQKTPVRGAVARSVRRTVAAVRRAIGIETREQLLRRRLTGGTDVGPAPGEAGGVHEVEERCNFLVAFEIRPYVGHRQVAPERAISASSPKTV